MSTTNPWELYERLIEGIPAGIGVKDWSLGRRWSCVESELGCGIALTVSGGGTLGKSGHFLGSEAATACTLDLRELASHARAWCFEEASIGVAALNAFYNATSNNPPLAAQLEQTGQTQAFAPQTRSDQPVLRQSDIVGLEIDAVPGKKVAVIGHFPHLDGFADTCELTILERNPSGTDLPDPACEYILPEQDLVIITGTALTNKTLPRLLTLSSSARVVIAGPSSVCSSTLFDYGVDVIGGALVVGTEATKRVISHGVQLPFGHGVEMVVYSR
jgi:uncharacterized protein (DUF4213/DUF364 family)